MFITGKPVTGKNFIGRQKHLPLFKTYIDHNQSFMIKAPRRFGKTSLVKHMLKNKKEYVFVYVDIKRANSLEALANTIINKAYKIFSIDDFLYKAKNSMFDLLKSIQELELDDIAERTVRMLENKNLDEVAYFLHSLDVMNYIAKKKDVNIKFALDEFQDILNVSPDGILDKSSSVMKQHENITYIFLGSMETIMTRIFEHKSSPFFPFVTIVSLPPLDIVELYEYSILQFQEKGIKCESLLHLLEYLQGHPDYSLQVLQQLYFKAISNDIKELTNKDVYDTLIDVILNNKAYLDEVLSKAKLKKHSLNVLYSIANKEKFNLDSKTLYNVRSSLEDRGLIKKIGQGKYIINNIFLDIYFQQKEEKISLPGYSLEL